MHSPDYNDPTLKKTSQRQPPSSDRTQKTLGQSPNLAFSSPPRDQIDNLLITSIQYVVVRSTYRSPPLSPMQLV